MKKLNLPVARYKEDYLSDRDLSCGFDEQVNYFSEPVIINTLFKV